MSPSDLEQTEVLQHLELKVQQATGLPQGHRTAKLWLQYISMITIMCEFIKAERLGLWSVHLQCMYEMLSYLAASGHSRYVKCVHLCLVKMLKLQNEMPLVYKHFEEGHHVVCSAERHWAGLWTDLRIE